MKHVCANFAQSIENLKVFKGWPVLLAATDRNLGSVYGCAGREGRAERTILAKIRSPERYLWLS